MGKVRFFKCCNSCKRFLRTEPSLNQKISAVIPRTTPKKSSEFIPSLIMLFSNSRIGRDGNTRGTMKCPKKYVKDVFFTWGHMHFILKCPKIEDFHFRFISRFQTSHVFFWKWGKWGHFEKFEHRKSGPKMKVFDFGAFQNKMHMASREKYIFHILFEAFHGTPRRENSLLSKDDIISSKLYSLYAILDWLAISIIEQIFKKQSNTPWNRQNRFDELRYRTCQTYGLLLFRIWVWFWNKLLIGVACKHFRMFWAKLLLRIRSKKFWKWILDPVRARNHSYHDYRWTLVLNNFFAPGATEPRFEDWQKTSGTTYIRPWDGADARFFDFTKMVKNS